MRSPPTIVFAVLCLATILSCSGGDETLQVADPPGTTVVKTAPGTAVAEAPAAILSVEHTPNPATGVRDGRGCQEYTWEYATSVTAAAAVTITGFGAETWDRGRWQLATLYGRPFTAEEFAEWYACPGARIAAGQTVTDLHNYSASEHPVMAPMRWYFVGVDAQGDTVRGEAVVDHLTLE